MVLAPLVIGLGINTFTPKISREVGKYTPFLSVLLVSAICGTISGKEFMYLNDLTHISLCICMYTYLQTCVFTYVYSYIQLRMSGSY